MLADIAIAFRRAHSLPARTQRRECDCQIGQRLSGSHVVPDAREASALRAAVRINEATHLALRGVR